MNKQNRNRAIDAEKKLMAANREWLGGWLKKVEGNKRYELPVIK